MAESMADCWEASKVDSMVAKRGYWTAARWAAHSGATKALSMALQSVGLKAETLVSSRVFPSDGRTVESKAARRAAKKDESWAAPWVE